MTGIPDFSGIASELEAQDADRERLIALSRTIRRESKTAIFLSHEGKGDEASQALERAKSAKDGAPGKTPEDVGAYHAALEEYAEAGLLLAFLKDEELPDKDRLGVSTTAYLGGVCDFAGELARVAVRAAIDHDDARVERCWQVARAFEGALTPLHLTGALRKKYDSIKYHVQHIEQVRYDRSGRKNT